MRIVVAILATLAVMKIYVQDQIYRTAVTEALVTAYRDQAIKACRTQKRNQPAGTGHLLWSNPSLISVSIGRDDVDISVWDPDHELWNAAYKTPYLVLEPSDPLTPLKCTFDITSGVASVSARST